VRALAAFVVRLAGYAIALGLVARLGEWLWDRRGLDRVFQLQSGHDAALTVLALAPIGLALLGVGVLRPLAVFVASFLIGAALTAPFAFARLAGG
jgi:hypothetical protein